MSGERTLDVNVHHITRVEGHGNIVLNVTNGTIEKLDLEIVESPRFFEAFLRGKSWEDVNHITSRICGICATGHTCASLAATEDAMGIEVTEQTRLLRRLVLNGEFLQSHILHVYFLVAPDLLGVGSVIPLAEIHPEVVTRALRLKGLANEICHVVSGRHIHPISMVPGGFTNTVTERTLRTLRAQLEEAIPDIAATVDTIASLELPDVSRPTEYLALRHPEEYSFLEGELYSTAAGEFPRSEYREIVRERMVSHSMSKQATIAGKPYGVGALARANINFDKVGPEVKAAAMTLGFSPPSTNPFHNNVAQVLESAHCLYDSIATIDKLLERGIRPEKPEVTPRAGHGVGAVEVPRGLLFHEYEYDDDGRIVDANLVIPTGQNLANCEADLREFVPRILDRSEEEIVDFMEGIVRSYDPCISCSVHLLDVEFVR